MPEKRLKSIMVLAIIAILITPAGITMARPPAPGDGDLPTEDTSPVDGGDSGPTLPDDPSIIPDDGFPDNPPFPGYGAPLPDIGCGADGYYQADDYGRVTFKLKITRPPIKGKWYIDFGDGRSVKGDISRDNLNGSSWYLEVDHTYSRKGVYIAVFKIIYLGDHVEADWAPVFYGYEPNFNPYKRLSWYGTMYSYVWWINSWDIPPNENSKIWIKMPDESFRSQLIKFVKEFYTPIGYCDNTSLERVERMVNILKNSYTIPPKNLSQYLYIPSGYKKSGRWRPDYVVGRERLYFVGETIKFNIYYRNTGTTAVEEQRINCYLPYTLYFISAYYKGKRINPFPYPSPYFNPHNPTLLIGYSNSYGRDNPQNPLWIGH